MENLRQESKRKKLSEYFVCCIESQKLDDGERQPRFMAKAYRSFYVDCVWFALPPLNYLMRWWNNLVFATFSPQRQKSIVERAVEREVSRRMNMYFGRERAGYAAGYEDGVSVTISTLRRIQERKNGSQ